MQVKCVICDSIETLDDNCFRAKRLRNRRIHMYLCHDCHTRIDVNTKKRHATGNFHLYDTKKNTKELI